MEEKNYMERYALLRDAVLSQSLDERERTRAEEEFEVVERRGLEGCFVLSVNLADDAEEECGVRVYDTTFTASKCLDPDFDSRSYFQTYGTNRLSEDGVYSIFISGPPVYEENRRKTVRDFSDFVERHAEELGLYTAHSRMYVNREFSHVGLVKNYVISKTPFTEDDIENLDSSTVIRRYSPDRFYIQIEFDMPDEWKGYGGSDD